LKGETCDLLASTTSSFTSIAIVRLATHCSLGWLGHPVSVLAENETVRAYVLNFCLRSYEPLTKRLPYALEVVKLKVGIPSSV
jgi:hypothetical protein